VPSHPQKREIGAGPRAFAPDGASTPLPRGQENEIEQWGWVSLPTKSPRTSVRTPPGTAPFPPAGTAPFLGMKKGARGASNAASTPTGL
jgi:hypothetical protein